MAGPCQYPPICHLPWPRPRACLRRRCIVVCVLPCLVDADKCTNRFRTRSQRNKCAVRPLLGCGMMRHLLILGCLVVLVGLLADPPHGQRDRVSICTTLPFGNGCRRRTCSGCVGVVGLASVGRAPRCVLRSSWLLQPLVAHFSSGRWVCHREQHPCQPGRIVSALREAKRNRFFPLHFSVVGRRRVPPCSECRLLRWRPGCGSKGLAMVGLAHLVVVGPVVPRVLAAGLAVVWA